MDRFIVLIGHCDIYVAYALPTNRQVNVIVRTLNHFIVEDRTRMEFV